MRLFSSTVCCLALAIGVAGADVPASPSAKPVPRPPTTTLATTVRVFPASAGTSHPARIQVKVPRATLQALLLQRAERDGAATDPVGLAQVTPSSDDAPGSTGTRRTVVAGCALALAVLLLPVLRRHRRSAALAVALLMLTAAWSARADIAPPGLRGDAAAQPSTPARGPTQPTPATLELVVTDDGSSGILLTHASPR